MTQTEKEIFAQPEALRKIRAWFDSNARKAKDFFAEANRRKYVFIGCGSSFMISQSGMSLFASIDNADAYALAGGDFLVDPENYRNVLKDSVVIILTRSGLTSEIVRSAEILKSDFDVKILTITMKEENELADKSDFMMTFPWAYDQSVCQTQTVTSIYYALLRLYAELTENQSLRRELSELADGQDAFLRKYRTLAQRIALKDFTNAIVLCDGVPNGMAQEGALAFTEVAMLPGQAFHLLDYRHGPKVLNNGRTLTIAALKRGARELQTKMIEDLRKTGTTLVVLDSENIAPQADFHVEVPSFSHPLMGIFLINICQMISLEKALAMGNNPDHPKGLDAYIKL